MSLSPCKKCGININWDNPHIHYGGHTCQEIDLKHMEDCKAYGLSVQEYRKLLYLNKVYGEPMPVILRKEDERGGV